MSRLELNLVPVHPDLAAGLKFVGYSVRVYAVLGLALGLIVAGKVANEIQYKTEALLPWQYVVPGFVVFIVALFTGPLLVFVGKLLRTWRRGVADYGALAGKLGRQFERRWFGHGVSVDEETLAVPDFSTMTDLYQFVANVYQMRVIPVDLMSLVFLVIVTLLPFLPVILMVVPLDSLFRTFASFLL
jgi:hypothetical protein